MRLKLPLTTCAVCRELEFLTYTANATGVHLLFNDVPGLNDATSSGFDIVVEVMSPS